MYTAVLVFHILVACTTIVALSWAAYSLVRGNEVLRKRLAIAIAILASVETVSGFSLAVLSPTVTVEKVALHLLVYLSACLIAEALLVLKMRRVWIG